MAAKPAPIDQRTLAIDYNFAYSILQSVPELKKIFDQAVAGTWADDKFLASVRGTKWFRTTSDTQRLWIQEQSEDPKTANQRLATRMATLRAEAGQLGIPLGGAQLKDVALKTIMYGWTDPQLRQNIASYWKYNATTASAGLAGQSVDKIKGAANAYLVPLSNAAINTWTQQILAGDKTADDFTEYAKQQAKSMFPTLTRAIDSGQTVQQYADPYKQTASQLLGINANDIDFNDPKWRVALDTVDPKTKDHVPMSLADWGTKVRTDKTYGWQNTAVARDQAAGAISRLGQMWGFQ